MVEVAIYVARALASGSSRARAVRSPRTRGGCSQQFVEVRVDANKHQGKDDELDASGTAQFRAGLMGHGWRVTQTTLQFSRKVAPFAQKVNEATVADLKEADSLIGDVKRTPRHSLVIHNFRRMPGLRNWSGATGCSPFG